MPNSRNFELSGQIVCVVSGQIFPGKVTVADGRIKSIQRLAEAPGVYIMPGFVDAHVHIESSMMTPALFGRIAPVWGTVATVSDPHEIANVLGKRGVYYMLEDARRTLLKIRYMMPTCVPATSFETAGGRITLDDFKELIARPDIYGGAELMNFPGALAGDPELCGMIEAALAAGKVVDGHFPRGRGEQMRRYAALGITSDHECVGIEEGREKIAAGIKVIIREGSAAKNFNALIPLIGEHPESIMFCSDDLHPDRLYYEGHINLLVARAIALGYDPMAVIRAATQNPVQHYKLDVGLLQEGDPADFIVVRDLVTMQVLETFIDGVLVAAEGRALQPLTASPVENNFDCSPITVDHIAVRAGGTQKRVIGIVPGELVTESLLLPVREQDGFAVADPAADVLKLVVVNRYHDAPPAVGFVKGFNLRVGAMASSVGHDSHNIVATGGTDDEIVRAVNAVIAAGGGIALTLGDRVHVLPLPVAGLMAAEDGEGVAESYRRMDSLAKEAGSTLPAPFMSLSFLILLVIASLKLSDKGLFDGDRFEFVDLFA